MSDGSRLEGRGVIPDELLLPTALALANKTDPLLAYVADKFGVSLTAANAGEIYFNDRRVEIDDDDER